MACDPDALIASLVLANADSGTTLTLARDCTYTLTANQSGDGLPIITQPITINGNNATIARAANATAFRIFDVGNGGNLTLQNLTVAGGRSVTQSPSGGGIHVQPGGAARIIHVTVKNNASATRGGGLYNDQGVVSVTDSAFTGNNAGDAGGAIFNAGSLTVNNSTLTDNFGSRGGALFNAGALDINNSTLSRNRVLLLGGGLFVDSVAGQTTVNHSTISDNSAVASGGGIHSESSLFLRNSMVTGNNTVGNGGGIDNFRTLVVEDSKVSDNSARLFGAGVFNSGSTANTVLRRSEVSRNNAIGSASTGGGIFNAGGTVALFSSQVTDNTTLSGPGGIFTSNAGVTTDQLSVIVRNRPGNCVGGAAVITNCFG